MHYKRFFNLLAYLLTVFINAESESNRR